MEWKGRGRLESTAPVPAQIGASTIDTQSQGGVPVGSAEWRDRAALIYQPWSDESQNHYDEDRARPNASDKRLKHKHSYLANNQLYSSNRVEVKSFPGGPELSRRLEGEEALKAYREYDRNWNPNMYLNLQTGRFECCNRPYDSVEKLTEHMIEHVARRFR